MTRAGSDFDRFVRPAVAACLVVAGAGGVVGWLVLGPPVGRGFAFGALGGALGAWVQGRAVAGFVGCAPARAARRARLLWALRFVLRAVPPVVAAFSSRFSFHAALVGVVAVQVVVVGTAVWQRWSSSATPIEPGRAL